MLMTSLIFFGCFAKFLAYTLFLPSFIVVRYQMVESNWAGFFAPLVHNGGISDPVQNRVDTYYSEIYAGTLEISREI